MGEVLRSHGFGMLAALSGGTAVSLSALVGTRVMSSRLQHSLHVGRAGVAAVLLGAIAGALGLGPLAGLVADRRGRAAAAGSAVVVAAAAGALVASARSVALAAVFTVVVGAAVAVQATGALAWLADRYPAGARGRVFGLYAVALPVAGTVGALAVGALGAGLGSWRWGMLAALAGLPVAIGIRRLASGTAEPAAGGGDDRPGIAISNQRLRHLRCFVGLVAAVSAVCFAAVGAPLIASTYLEHHWHQQLDQRGHILLVAVVGALVGAPLGGVLGDRAWARGVKQVAPLLGASVGSFGLLLAVAAYLPDLWMVDVAWVLVTASAAAAAVLAAQLIVAVAPPATRAATLGLFAAYGLVFGGLVATTVVAAVSQADGARLALAAAGIAVAAAGAVAWVSGDRVAADVTAVAEEADDEARVAARRDRPGRAGPMALEVRQVDFSYGARQVLFGVDLKIAEGEVAALLGTNGAGKSTLLRLVSGLDHPSAGSIRLWERSTTYLEAEQVVGLGVAMLPGGRMSFPGLTVLENLRVGGHTIRRQGPRLQSSMDEVMGLFPVLGERRDQRVGTLSGGEQQMLALARVLLTRPRMLLIDELSLGLAPKAVESLLATVRRVNEQGTTVLLVEQSVNLALTLAEHAVFIERGEVRFDGRTSDLMARDDLLRPVFLGGR
jgi:ABC-type branched-subunit amino acid transport system ATPase component